jgi:hypothetical protein
VRKLSASLAGLANRPIIWESRADTMSEMDHEYAACGMLGCRTVEVSWRANSLSVRIGLARLDAARVSTNLRTSAWENVAFR